MKESRHVVRFRETHLKADETIIAWGKGYIGEMMGEGDKTQHNGVLIVTEHRVVFYRKGILFGEVLKTVPLKLIMSIERRALPGHPRIIELHASCDQLEFKTFSKTAERELVEAIEIGRGRAETQ